MTTIEQRLYNGARAKEVLENEVFQAVFSDMEEDIISKWKSAPARDQEGREKLWEYLQILQRVKADLTTTLETGKLATLELEQKNKKTLMEQLGGMISPPRW